MNGKSLLYRIVSMSLCMLMFTASGCKAEPKSTEKPAKTSNSSSEITTAPPDTQPEVIDKKPIDSKFALSNVTVRGLRLSNFLVIADSQSNNAALNLQRAIKLNTGYSIGYQLEEHLYKFSSKYIYLMTLPINGKTYDLGKNEVLYYEENGNFYIILGSRDILETHAVKYFLTEILKLNEDYTASVSSDPIDLTGFNKKITLQPDPELARVSVLADNLKNKIVDSDNHYSAADVTGKGKCYYVSASGNDANDGLTPATAWLTLAKIGGQQLPAGSVVLFERGGTWRGSLILKSNVIYSSYGQGDKPKIYGSTRDATKVGKWNTTDTPNVWVYSIIYGEDVGNIIFNGGEAWGYKRIPTVKDFNGTIGGLKSNFQFWHDNTSKLVYLYYDGGNPSEKFDSIELAVKGNIIRASSEENIIFDNFCLKYGGAHGVSTSNVNNFTVQYCEIGWVGGSLLDGAFWGGTVRYGNGIQIGANADGVIMDHNYVYQMYDTGLTNQFDSRANPTSTASCLQKDLKYTNNLVDYCFWGFEYYIHLDGANDDRKMENIRIADNIIRYAGFGWGFQRPDVNKTAARLITGNTAKLEGTFIIENNILALSHYLLAMTRSANEDKMPLHRNNYYLQYEENQGVTIAIEPEYPKWDQEELAQHPYLKDRGNTFYTVK